MPHIVPSQVVAAIDRLFGPSRSELADQKILFMHRDNVRTLLALLDQVRDDLIAIPFSDYTQYLQCKSSLTSALNMWDAQGKGPAVPSPSSVAAAHRQKHFNVWLFSPNDQLLPRSRKRK